MSHHSRLFGTLALFLSSSSLAAVAWADPVQLVKSDEHGVTIRLDFPDFQLAPDREAGRSVIRSPLTAVTRVPGRPALPLMAVTLALPPGAQPVARVLEASGEEVREGVALAPNGKPGFRGDQSNDDMVPVIEPVAPITDGAWPPSPVELGDVYTLRRQRLVPVRIQPFRYAEASRTLTFERHVTVRVDFVGGSPARGTSSRDAHWTPVLRGSVLNFDQAQSWREPPAALLRGFPGGAIPRGLAPLRSRSTASFADNNIEVRIRTDTSGVYAFRYEDVAAHGYPAGIRISQVSVHRHEFIENSNPTYVAVEIPIEVDDANADSVFDAGDRIVTFVQGWAQRARASLAQRTWGDGEVLYATYITDRPPLRIATRPGWRNLSLSSLLSYPWTQRFEQARFYTRTPVDTNSNQFEWSDVLAFTRRDSFAFETNDLDTTRQAALSVSWIGSKSAAHYLWFKLRNFKGQYTSIADSVRSDGFSSASKTTTMFGSALSEGPTNWVVGWGKSSIDAILSYASMDGFTVNYWRYYLALEGSLSCNSGDASGPYQIHAEGFTSANMRVYDVTDSLNPVRLDVDASHIEWDGFAGAITFQDSTGGQQRQYVAFDQPKVLAPDRFGTVTQRHLADSPSPNYLIVVPEDWIDVANTLSDFRKSQGYSTLVAPLESIDDEFNGGRRSSYALKRFFQYALNVWDSEFVILLGDGSEDPLNRLGDSGIDFIPCQKILGPVSSGEALEAIPSDNWLVTFGYDPRYPTPRLNSVPEMFLGRIPANSHDDLAAVVNKIIKYENITPDQTWRHDVLLLADDKYSTQTFFGGGGGSTTDYCEKDYELVFKALSDSVQSIIYNHAGLGLMNAEVFDLTYYLRPIIPYYVSGGDTCRGLFPGDPNAWPDTQRRSHAIVTPQVFDRLNQGRLLWNYQGHANQYVLAHEDLYVNRGVNDDKMLFTNVDKPFIFAGFSCHPNGFAMADERSDRRGPALGEEMVMLPDRGAVASWASSGYEILPYPKEIPAHLNTRFANRLFANPPRDTLGDYGARVVLGEVINQTFVDNRVESGQEGLVGWTYTLLGDPATRVSIGAPEMIVTANGVPVTNGEPVRLFSFGDTLRIEAELVSNVQLKTLDFEFRDASSTRVIPPAEYTLTPAFPDTGASGSGGRRFHLSYKTTLSAGSYRFVIRSTDRNGVPAQFDVVFEFQTQLRANNVPIRVDDPIRSDAALSLLILSPSPIQPSTDIELLFGPYGGPDVPLVFATQPFNQDTTRREWLLTWTHNPFTAGRYELKVKLNGQQVAVHGFTISDRAALESLMPFPNPFDDELGTRFSFTFTGAQPFDLLVRVYTVAGHLIYEHSERDLNPGYHQIPWDGRDAEGQKIANGIYIYKLLAKSGSGNVVRQGTLVKLRKPRHIDVSDETGTPP